MKNIQNNLCSIIWKSFFITGILQIIPYPSKFLHLLKPSWINLMLIYWVTKIPKRINIGCGFIVGLITDILSGPILVIHAIIMSTIIYLLLIKLTIFYNMLIWHQALVITLFSFNTDLIIYLTYITFMNTTDICCKIFFNYLTLLHSMLDGIIWIGILSIMCKINIDKKIQIHTTGQ